MGLYVQSMAGSSEDSCKMLGHALGRLLWSLLHLNINEKEEDGLMARCSREIWWGYEKGKQNNL